MTGGPDSGGPDYGRGFALWRAAAGAQWQGYVRHDFVLQLGEGTLPRRAFLHYLVQDYLFLGHFSRAWALAVTKADTLEEMRACAVTVSALLCDEMQLHEAICAAEGISATDLARAREETATIAYTRYVMDAGHAGDFTDLLAALAPCVLGYGEIGAALAPSAARLPASAGLYRDWIETYAGASYQQTCHEVGALIDAALLRRLGPQFADMPRWPVLVERFRTATRLEAEFWQMGLGAGASLPSVTAPRQGAGA